MPKIVFIIGFRRSGTSFLRQLVKMSPDVEDILFEPHELLFSAQTIHIPRYQKSEYHIKSIEKFKGHKKIFGAKIALNPGIEAMNWLWLEEKFDKPHYIFIMRKPEDTYDSWIKHETSVRGIIPFDMYDAWWFHINVSFLTFAQKNPERSVILTYEDLCRDANKTMDRVWKVLGLHSFDKDLNKLVKKGANYEKNSG